nr:EOG090X0G73 [Artemia franciscana]
MGTIPVQFLPTDFLLAGCFLGLQLFLVGYKGTGGKFFGGGDAKIAVVAGFSVSKNPTVEASSSYLKKCGILLFLLQERSRITANDQFYLKFIASSMKSPGATLVSQYGLICSMFSLPLCLNLQRSHSQSARENLGSIPGVTIEISLVTNVVPTMTEETESALSDDQSQWKKRKRLDKLLDRIAHQASLSRENSEEDLNQEVDVHIKKKEASLSPKVVGQVFRFDSTDKERLLSSAISEETLSVKGDYGDDDNVFSPSVPLEKSPISSFGTADSPLVLPSNCNCPKCQQKLADLSISPSQANLVLPRIEEPCFVCQSCGQMFNLQDRLAKHIASRHKSKPRTFDTANTSKAYSCEICQRTFARSDMLTRHMRLHTGLKPYTCKTCGQVFSRSDHLSTHQRTHTGEKPYRCPSCPYAACRRDMITRHMRTHLKGDPGTPSIGAASTLDQSKGRQKRNRLRELIRSQSAEDAPPSSPALNITGLSVRSPTPSEMEADG